MPTTTSSPVSVVNVEPSFKVGLSSSSWFRRLPSSNGGLRALADAMLYCRIYVKFAMLAGSVR